MIEPLEIGVATWSFQIPETRFDEILHTVKEKVKVDLIQVGAFGHVELTQKIQDQWFESIQKFDLKVAATCVAFLGEDYSSVPAAIETVGFYDPGLFEGRFRHLCNMADLTEKLGVDLLTTHLGYIPHDVNSPEYAHMLDVTRRIADVLGGKGINFGLEVGGLETAEDLLRFVEKTGRPNVKINYDPANLVRTLIDDPIESFDVLKDYVVMIHFKDALPPEKRCMLGELAALGRGAVNVPGFVARILETGYRGPLMIEGEGGYDTVRDVCEAIDLLQSLLH